MPKPVHVVHSAVALTATFVAAQHAREGTAAEVHELTGAHTRVVWVQRDGSDPFAAGDQLVLMDGVGS